MTTIHRYLDEAFAGVEVTPDVQDLKEELRGNLAARAAELEAAGTDAPAAAARAIDELGDIPALIASLGAPTGQGSSAAELLARHRVRPKPQFVLAAVMLSLLATAAAVVVALVAVGLVALPWWVSPVVLAVAVGALVDYSLRQETSQNFRLPSGRAAGYGLAALALALGLGFVGAFFGAPEPGILIAGIVAALGGVAGFIWFGVTQTNRKKPWVLELGRATLVEDRFQKDPAAAARFGIYTVIIWITGFALFIVLSFTVGFVWSWLALVASVVVFFLVLARMLFTVEAAK